MLRAAPVLVLYVAPDLGAARAFVIGPLRRNERAVGAANEFGDGIVRFVDNDVGCAVLLWSKNAAHSTSLLRAASLVTAAGAPIVLFRIDDTPIAAEYAYAAAVRRTRGAGSEAKLIAAVKGHENRPVRSDPQRLTILRELRAWALVAAGGPLLVPFSGPQHAGDEPSPLSSVQGPPYSTPSVVSAPQVSPPASLAEERDRVAPRESVQFRCAMRRNAAPSQEFTARFVAYPLGADARARALLLGVDGHAEARDEYSETCWAVGTTATVACHGDWFTVEPTVQSFVWQRGVHALDFDVRVVADAPAGMSTRLKFDIAVEGIIVARLRAEVRIVGAEAATTEQHQVTARSARTAFASYASEDRLRVLDRVASVHTAAGLDGWLDCINLRPSERWRELLGPAIVERDLFLLFWSQHAADSAWVDWEWRCALEQKGLQAMQVHPLDNARRSLPVELRELHATDPLMDVRQAELERRLP